MACKKGVKTAAGLLDQKSIGFSIKQLAASRGQAPSEQAKLALL
jgi:hypothetical protein